MRTGLWAGAAAASVSLLLTATAQAEIFTPGLYTVLNYLGDAPDFKKIPGVEVPSYLDGAEVDAGWRFNRFYSVEASYAYDTGSKNLTGDTFRINVQTAAVDAMGYLPMGRSAWSLFGEAGVAATFSSTQADFPHRDSQTSFGGRAGGGLVYQFDDHLGVRIAGRYEWTGLSYMKSAAVGTFGLVWQR